MATFAAFCIFAGALQNSRLDFYQKPGSVSINGSIVNLAPGLHGFHVHQNGNLSQKCLAAGPHFNPSNMTHGSPNSPNRHVGDLGNIEADSEGVALININDRDISLTPGSPHYIVGRSIVVHEKIDDLGLGGDAESLKTGNAGGRIDCCIITKSRERCHKAFY